MRKYLLLCVILLSIFLIGCTPAEASDVTIILNPGIDTVEVNTAFVDAGAKSTAFGFKITSQTISSDVDITHVGTYEIVYQANWRDRVIKEITRMVSVIDETAPTGEINAGLDTIVEGEVWVDGGITALDNSNLSVTIVISGEVLSDYPGEYIIQYTLSDASENTRVILRYVTVLPAED